MKNVILEATKADQIFKIVEKMGFVNETVKKHKTVVYELQENGKTLSIDLRPQIEMYKSVLVKEGFNIKETVKYSLESIIMAYEVGFHVRIEEFYMNEFELEISAYIEGSSIRGAKTFFIKENQLIFILEKMGFIIDNSEGIFDTFQQIEFRSCSEIYDFYSFSEVQKSQILKYYLLYKMYI